MTELFERTAIKDCYKFKSSHFRDQRGSFSKSFSAKLFESLGFNIPVAEVYFSSSHKNVLRGMHFQAPPHDQVKVVSCLNGRVLDVILDLRPSSPSFEKAISVELTADNETTLIIPRGCAHGFYAFEDNSILSYVVETHHDKESDQGVLWDSFGFIWPCKKPIISFRDGQLPSLQSLKNPFR